MEFLQTIKGRIPDYAKDICLNLDDTTLRSSLEGNDAVDVTLVAALTAKNKVLTDTVRSIGVLSFEEMSGALAAAVLTGMNSAWYPYVEMTDDSDFIQQKAELRMNTCANNGGVDKRRFEIYALTAPIIGKCHSCVKPHYDLPENHRDMSTQQLRNVGRIATIISATV